MPRSASKSNWVSGCASASTFYIAESKRQGIREAAKYYEENMKMFGELRLVNRAMTDEQIEIMRDPKLARRHAKLPRIEDAVNAGGFLTGSPDEIIEHLKKVEKAYPGLIGSRSACRRRTRSGGAGAIGTVRQGSDAGVQGSQS